MIGLAKRMTLLWVWEPLTNFSLRGCKKISFVFRKVTVAIDATP